jgi:hypothetical protein
MWWAVAHLLFIGTAAPDRELNQAVWLMPIGTDEFRRAQFIRGSTG